jgi:DNA replication initiation complex subunit (GINS family)
MLTYEVIRKLAMDEKAAPKLNKLPQDFFENVRVYLEKKEKIAQSKEDRWELDSARRWLQDLLDIRERKLLMIAPAFIKSGVMPGEATYEEKEFFDHLVEQIKEFQSRKKEVFEGKRERLNAVAFLQDVPKFIGTNMHNYGPFKIGDVANIPEGNAKLLTEKQVAKRINCL